MYRHVFQPAQYEKSEREAESAEDEADHQKIMARHTDEINTRKIGKDKIRFTCWTTFGRRRNRDEYMRPRIECVICRSRLSRDGRLRRSMQGVVCRCWRLRQRSIRAKKRCGYRDYPNDSIG